MARRAARQVGDALEVLTSPDAERADVALDALRLRFPVLVNLVIEHVFRLISESQGLPRPRRTSKRDMLDDMKALEVVADADRLFDALLLRNRLEREPLADAGDEAALVPASRDYLAALDSAEAWARARGLIPT